MDDLEFEKVFWVLQPQLLHYASSHLDRAAAEDAVSNTLLSLLRKPLAYPRDDGEERGLRSLAFKILIGHISNEHRSRRRRQALSIRLTSREQGMTTEPSPEATVIGQATVDTWLDRMSPSDRHIILLFNAGFDARELANILGCSEAAAAKRRARARDRLKAMIDNEREGP